MSLFSSHFISLSSSLPWVFYDRRVILSAGSFFFMRWKEAYKFLKEKAATLLKKCRLEKCVFVLSLVFNPLIAGYGLGHSSLTLPQKVFFFVVLTVRLWQIAGF